VRVGAALKGAIISTGEPAVPRKRQLLVILLLIMSLLVSSAGCTFFKTSHETKASAEPINPNWEPVYVQTEVLPLLDTDNLVALIAPTVVSIISEQVSYDRFFRAVPERGAGSGVIIDPNGYIVTNAHVVEDADSLTVVLYDGQTFDAVAWVMDTQTDLAVVEIEPREELPYAHFLSSSLTGLKLLEDVVAVGNALALPEGPTWTRGVVSYLGRSIEETNGVVLDDLVQTDAAINPGNSGGPLVNMAGQVVGINTAIAAEAQNIGFSISTDTSIPVINSLVKKGVVSWAWLGVKMLTVTQSIKEEYGLSVDYGALIVEILSNSPADNGGLKPDDVIIKFGDVETRDTDQLRAAIRSHVPGDKVTVTYIRDQGPATTTEVTLVQRPS
jgi:serine protease Do